jgi:hypothetical protein
VTDFFWALHQDRQLAEAERQADAGRRAADQANSRIRDLEADVDRLRLACAAMWSLLKERCSVSDQEFADRLRDLDLRDGKLDGRMAPEASTCSKCGRVMSARHQRCMYCGAEGLQTGPFNGRR